MIQYFGKTFFKLLHLSVCETFLFRESKIFVVYVGLHKPFFAFPEREREDQIDTVYGNKISFSIYRYLA